MADARRAAGVARSDLGGGRFMRFGEAIEAERLVDLLRPMSGSTPF